MERCRRGERGRMDACSTFVKKNIYEKGFKLGSKWGAGWVKWGLSYPKCPPAKRSTRIAVQSAVEFPAARTPTPRSKLIPNSTTYSDPTWTGRGTTDRMGCDATRSRHDRARMLRCSVCVSGYNKYWEHYLVIPLKEGP